MTVENWKGEKDITTKKVAVSSEELPTVTIIGGSRREIQIDKEFSIGVIAKLTECEAGEVQVQATYQWEKVCFSLFLHTDT